MGDLIIYLEIIFRIILENLVNTIVFLRWFNLSCQLDQLTPNMWQVEPQDHIFGIQYLVV